MKPLMLLLFAFSAMLIASETTAQSNKKPVTSGIQVIQFHSEHRCVTCFKIEKLTKSTLTKSFPAITFKLVNVEDKANAKMAEQFEAAGTALFLYDPQTGKKKELTDFAFMKAGNETAFDAELKKYIEDFIKK